MMSLMYILLISILLSSFFIFINMMISKKMTMNREKLSMFECGFDSQSNTRLPFSIHFFMITVMFLIFDVEIAILIPLVPSMFFSNPFYWHLTLSMFILILILGTYNEWWEDSMKWMK